jgi:hypothetical protein
MSQRVICDACGEVIDQSVAYYTYTSRKLLVEGADDPDVINVPTVVQIARTYDFHDGHQPPIGQVEEEPPVEDDKHDDKDKDKK